MTEQSIPMKIKLAVAGFATSPFFAPHSFKVLCNGKAPVTYA
jgi:hypothetical protein